MSIHSKTPSGFTLIELLVTMAISSIILLVAGGLLSSSGESYSRVGGNVHAEREARALINQLASDLTKAHFHPKTLIEKSDKPWAADRIGFLTLQPASAQAESQRIGDLCATSYYLDDLTVGGKTIRCLFRGFRDSTPTFAALPNNVPSLFTPETMDEPIAFGVISFSARPKTTSKDGVLIDWAPNDAKGPEYMEVRLVVARRDLNGRLRTPADWDGASPVLGNPADAEKNSDLKVYQTMIRFGNHATL